MVEEENIKGEIVGGQTIMTNSDQGCGLNSQKHEHAIQDAEISKTLKHIWKERHFSKS
jgi:hypothetical protein